MLDCIIGVVNIAVVYALLRFTDLGLYAIAGVSSALLLLKITIFVPMYAASNIGLKRRTFYPYLLRGIFLNAAVFCICGAVHRFMPISSWMMLIAAALITAVISYGAGFFVVFSSNERKKAFGAIRKRFRGDLY